MERVTYCNIKLPLPKPLLPEDSRTAQRLFIVCQPAAVPERILRDAFSRFGNLIEVYLLSGKVYKKPPKAFHHVYIYNFFNENIIWVCVGMESE